MFMPPKLKKTPFLQFRAGKMKYANGIVSAEHQKGYLSFMKHGSDSVEVAWTGRDSEIETVHTWRRSQVEVSRVDKCVTGRVFLFKVTENAKETLHFFWLQEKSDSKDADYLKKLKETFSVKNAGEGGAGSVQLEDLKKIIASISGTSSAADVSLSELVSSSKVADAIRADPDFYKSRVQATLPTELAGSSDFLGQVKNPQITHAATTLEAALRNPLTCKELCKMYGLPENTAGVSGFINSIINQAKKPE